MYPFCFDCSGEVVIENKRIRSSRQDNLVPRVSHLTAPSGKMRDPGNEVVAKTQLLPGILRKIEWECVTRFPNPLPYL